MEFISKKEQDLEKISEDILESILTTKPTTTSPTSVEEKDAADTADTTNTATVVGLYGDLGSAKTTFTKYFANQFGIKLDQIISPTFIIQKRFDVSKEGVGDFKNFYHLDVYRIEDPKEVQRLGWKDLISNPDNIILIEWANLIEEVLPENTLKINFETLSETERKITTDFK